VSTFGATIEVIHSIRPHPNADRLELATLHNMSYQFCVPKGQFVQGNMVYYFPIDSILPPPLIEALGLTGKLSGKDHNRVTTVKLRGEISQGLVAGTLDPKMIEVLVTATGKPSFPATFTVGTDVTAAFGVTKYEPPEVSIKSGTLVPLPPLVSVYDIEGADRHPQAVRMLVDKVSITEKLEGSHFSASLYKDGTFAVCQRNYRIIPDPGKTHDWHTLAELYDVEQCLNTLGRWLSSQNVVTVRGEVVGPGVQGNYYELKHRRIVFFELEVDGQPIDAMNALTLLGNAGLPTVPLLWTGYLPDFVGNKTLQEASNGTTALPDAAEGLLREGIVIRPMGELSLAGFGRLIIKQRSPEYLAKTGN
jgi:RNA ligase (TIGR02306 family)